MACNPFDAFPYATESLSPYIYKYAHFNNVMLTMVPREEYPQNKGIVQTTFAAAFNEPTNDVQTWTAESLSEGTNFCDENWNDYEVGYKARTWGPYKYLLRGPQLCRDTFNYMHNPDGFVGQYIEDLSVIASKEQENRLLQQYMLLSSKTIAEANFGVPAAENTFTLNWATSDIKQWMLDYCAAELTRRGAIKPDSNGFYQTGPEGPLWPILISPEASRNLFVNETGIRDDVRWTDAGAGKGSELMKRIGANRVLRNFRHIPHPFAPRFTYNGTAYVRVNTWVDDASVTKGSGVKLNPSYTIAPFEAAIILNPWVMKLHVVRPKTSVAGLKFGDTNHMGEWIWVTGGYKWDSTCVDPTHRFGRHFARFVQAIEPVFPQFGITIIYKRCPLDGGSITYCT